LSYTFPRKKGVLVKKNKYGDQLFLEDVMRIRKDDTVIVTTTDARTVKAFCRVS
jgi:hypothetical protein